MENVKKSKLDVSIRCNVNNYYRAEGQIVHLHNLTTGKGENVSGEIELESGSLASRQTFFPLAVDDYFMAVAILSSKVITWPV